MGLVLKETICLNTALGVSTVQLLLGDITQLPLEEKVDILFVSAFPGDYTLVPGTMVHALDMNLDLNVGTLARDKELNLLRPFNCWVSKPLPDHMPYERVVCFERMNRFEGIPDQISGIFRAMMAVFNNEEKTVITPLLATGNQGHSDAVVLRAIVTAACHWIKAGLPLRCLKIVIYTSDPQSPSVSQLELVRLFEKAKTKWEKSANEEVCKTKKKFDVCLSYSEEDAELASRVCDDLQKTDLSVVIHKEQFTYDHEQVWQEQIFTVMVQSHRIVAILTPSYVDKAECLEQFNLALCCNRLTGAEVLAPFYLKTVDAFPSYMMLIQYTECRVRKEGEKSEEKIHTACSMLISQISKDKYELSDKEPDSDSVSMASSAATSKASQPSGAYDVFISYSHKNPKEALKLYENLLDLEPDLRVFFDRSELHTGNIWQETLYEALDSAKVVVAFISQSYIDSTVCQEEYNIALARFLSEDKMYLLPLLIEADLKEIPAMYSAAPLVDMSNPSRRYEEQYCRLAEVPIAWLKGLKTGQQVLGKFCTPKEKTTDISQITMRSRERYVRKRFHIEEDENVSLRNAATASPEQMDMIKSVVFSFEEDCFQQASVICYHLQKERKISVKCEFLTRPEQSSGVQTPKLQLLDSADMIVLFVSDDYLASSQHRHELHIALGRQRMCKDKQVVYLIEAFHSTKHPVYAHLLPYKIGVTDGIWAIKASHTLVEATFGMPFAFLGSAQHVALYAAALDIVDKLIIGDSEGSSTMPTNIVNLIACKRRTDKQDSVQVSECLVTFSSLTGMDTSASKAADTSADEPGDAEDDRKNATSSIGDTETRQDSTEPDDMTVPERRVSSMKLDRAANFVWKTQKKTTTSTCQIL